MQKGLTVLVYDVDISARVYKLLWQKSNLRAPLVGRVTRTVMLSRWR